MQTDNLTLSKNSVWKMFDNISSTYDSLNHILSFGLDFYWRKKCASFLPQSKNFKLLDIATGTGDQLFSFIKRAPGITKAYGIDMSSEMLKIAQKKVERKNLSRLVKLKVASALDIPFPNETFDVLSISFGIRNVEDPLKALSEMHRVLKPGGRAIILEFSLPSHPSIQKGHLFYLRKILPRIGGIFSKNKEAYTYLNQTIETFPHGNDFLALMKKARFDSLYCLPLTFGTVTIYVGEKGLL